MCNKTYKHKNGIEMSGEISEEEKKYVKSMEGYKEFTQIPMLTEKILVLSNRIKKLNKNIEELTKKSGNYNKASIILGVNMFFIGFTQLVVLITTNVESSIIQILFIVIISIALFYILRISRKI